jgi:hypothetical protein
MTLPPYAFPVRNNVYITLMTPIASPVLLFSVYQKDTGHKEKRGDARRASLLVLITLE